METKVYPAGPPLQGQWVLSWRTNIMPVPAYWYYDTEESARDAERRILDERGRLIRNIAQAESVSFANGPFAEYEHERLENLERLRARLRELDKAETPSL
jgi:hypothetical protein